MCRYKTKLRFVIKRKRDSIFCYTYISSNIDFIIAHMRLICDLDKSQSQNQYRKKTKNKKINFSINHVVGIYTIILYVIVHILYKKHPQSFYPATKGGTVNFAREVRAIAETLYVQLYIYKPLPNRKTYKILQW